MKKIVILSALMITAHWAKAQSPALTWAQHVSATTVTVGSAVTSDAAGNVYTAGRFSGTIDLDPGAGTVNATAAPAGITDIYVSKLDAAGNYVWGRAIGSTGPDAAFGMTVDASGNVYVTGSFGGAVDFDPGPGVTTLTSAGGLDIFILKLDASGNFLWAKSIGAAGADEGSCVRVDGTGNVYTTGYFSSTPDFDPGSGVINMTASSGGTDGFVVKFDPAGNYLWANQVAASVTSVASSIAVYNTGECYLVGSYQGTIPAGKISSLAVTSAGSNDGFMMALNSSGTWNGPGAIIPTGSDDAFNAVALDQSRNALYLTGRYSGNIPVFGITNAGGYDIIVQKINLDALTHQNSGLAWTYGFGIAGNQEGAGIAVDALNGNIAVCGYIQGTSIDFDPSVSNTLLSATATSQDGFIAGYTGAGAFKFAFTVGNANYDLLSAVEASNLNVRATGFFQGTVDADPIGTTNITSGNAGSTFDAYVLNYSTCAPPPMPTNVTTPSNQTICAGNSTTLQVTGTGTVSWYSALTGGTYLGAGTSYTTPVLNTTTTYYAQDSTCYFGPRRAITVTVNSIPTLVATASATTLCYGDMLTLFATGATTYSWNNGVTNGAPFIDTTAGTTTYIVNGVTLSGCVCIPDTVVVTVNFTPAPVVGYQYVPLALTGFNNDIVANGNDYLTSTTTSVDANTDGCRFIDVTYTQFGTPTRYLPTGGAFYSQTTPAVPFQFASYTANNSLTLFTAGDTGSLVLNTPMAMNQFYLLATSGGGSTNLDGVIHFADGSTENMPNMTIDDWFNAPTYALQGVGRMYNNALGFQAPGDVNPRIYQYIINISPANQNKLVTAVTFTRNNPGSMKTQIMGMTARVSLQEFCASNHPTVGDLAVAGSNIQWYDISNALLSNADTLADGNVYYATQTLNGCESQSVGVSVSLLAAPVVTVNSPAVCAGSSVVLTASGADTYTWSTGGNTNSITVSPASTTSYTVTATDTSSSCSGTGIATVTVNALPTVTFPAFTSSLCDNGNPVALSGATPAGGTYSGPFVTGNTFDPAAAGGGTYLLTYTYSDANTCVNSDTASVTVDVCSGITEQENAAVTIAPNPNKGTFLMMASNLPADEIQISICNLQGQVVYSSVEQNSANGISKEITLENCATGIYFLKLQSGETISVYKIIKE